MTDPLLQFEPDASPKPKLSSVGGPVKPGANNTRELNQVSTRRARTLQRQSREVRHTYKPASDVKSNYSPPPKLSATQQAEVARSQQG
jgi:hypothetical protein